MVRPSLFGAFDSFSPQTHILVPNKEGDRQMVLLNTKPTAQQRFVRPCFVTPLNGFARRRMEGIRRTVAPPPMPEASSRTPFVLQGSAHARNSPSAPPPPGERGVGGGGAGRGPKSAARSPERGRATDPCHAGGPGTGGMGIRRTGGGNPP